ncbi:hypothetical protein ACFQNE_11510 [Gordonia phosphorivorans]|uniref:VWFA domain-containing protein n=1 Tax=Gordonia phosphorivorans TaxID=1056982 RepID=A0ABV6HAY3_9ACTN
MLADASASAEQSEMKNKAAEEFASAVGRLTAPGKVTLMAFNTQVGSSPCEPVVASLPWDPNSTTVDDKKKELVAQAPAAVAPYFECVETHTSVQGTDIIGGIAEAADVLRSTPGDKAISLVTDGCNNSYGANTCAIEVTDPAWRSARIEALPTEMKPDLTGVTLTITGLGRGADINSAQVQGLKAFFREYAEATHATYAG